MTNGNPTDWAPWCLVGLESLEIVILVVWIVVWSRIIIPRRRILAVLTRMEAQLDEKDRALELLHRENEAILVNALDIGKRFRHCLQRAHDYEVMINELRIRLGLEPLTFQPLVQIQSLRMDLEQKRSEAEPQQPAEATGQK
jgi:hypothetical protein